MDDRLCPRRARHQGRPGGLNATRSDLLPPSPNGLLNDLRQLFLAHLPPLAVNIAIARVSASSRPSCRGTPARGSLALARSHRGQSDCAGGAPYGSGPPVVLYERDSLKDHSIRFAAKARCFSLGSPASSLFMSPGTQEARGAIPMPRASWSPPRAANQPGA